MWGQVVRSPGIGCWEHIAEAKARRMLEAVGRWVEGNWSTVDKLFLDQNVLGPRFLGSGFFMTEEIGRVAG